MNKLNFIVCFSLLLVRILIYLKKYYMRISHKTYHDRNDCEIISLRTEIVRLRKSNHSSA